MQYRAPCFSRRAQCPMLDRIYSGRRKATNGHPQNERRLHDNRTPELHPVLVQARNSPKTYGIGRLHEIFRRATVDHKEITDVQKNFQITPRPYYHPAKHLGRVRMRYGSQEAPLSRNYS